MIHCPSCGTELAQGLSYCNRCGASLTQLVKVIEPSKLVGSVWALSLATTLVTLGGLAMIFSIVMFMIAERMVISEGSVALVFFMLLGVLVISALLIRQLSRLLTIYQQGTEVFRTVASELKGKHPALIESPRAASFSVTEHTTRTFDPVYGERKTP